MSFRLVRKKNNSPFFFKNGLPTFEKAAPTQPCQVEKPDRKLSLFATKAQLETPVQETET